jgi:trigger factor
MVPGQPLVFSTISPITPEVTKMPDLAACRIDPKKKEANDAMVEEALDEMRKMRRVETPVDRAATLDDMVIVDMEMTKDKVALEGGNGNGYRVYLNEPNYIPGLADQLVGMKPGDEKTFTLPFPKEHFQKHLAGQNVDFKVKAAEVFELQLPKVDDEFAKIVGLENLAQLRAKLKENMQAEMDTRSGEAAEIEMLEKLTDAASFGEIPDLLINEEVRRMMMELEAGLEDQGMDMATYLQQIKKTKDELKLDFTQQAMRRIRTAVLIKAYAVQEKVTVSDDELDAEVDRILAGLKDTDVETRERVTSPDYREYMSIQMRNRKTLDWLKQQCIK